MPREQVAPEFQRIMDLNQEVAWLGSCSIGRRLDPLSEEPGS
jgi:hypothetical protein